MAATSQTLKAGTKIEFTPVGGQPEPARIVRLRRIHLPLPGPGWHVVQFSDGGAICMHETAFRVVGKAA